MVVKSHFEAREKTKKIAVKTKKLTIVNRERKQGKNYEGLPKKATKRGS